MLTMVRSISQYLCIVCLNKELCVYVYFNNVFDKGYLYILNTIKGMEAPTPHLN